MLEGGGNIVLLDEKDPLESPLRVNSASQKIDHLYNVKQKRMAIEFVLNKELVKYMTLEGSSLTLLGLVRYNATKETFEMTELFSVLSGGLHEAKRCLTERIKVLKGAKKAFLSLQRNHFHSRSHH